MEKRTLLLIKLISIRYFIAVFLAIILGIKYAVALLPSLSNLNDMITSLSLTMFKVFGGFSVILQDVFDVDAVNLIESGTLGSIFLLVTFLLLYILLNYLVGYGLLFGNNWSRFAGVMLALTRVIINIINSFVKNVNNYYMYIGTIVFIFGTVSLLFTLNSLKDKKYYKLLLISSPIVIILGIIISNYNAAIYIENINNQLGLMISIGIAYYLKFNSNVEKFFFSKAY